MFALILLASLVLVMDSTIRSAQRVAEPSSDGQSSMISGVKFTVPKDFRLEQSSESEFAFMRHDKEALALFVAVLKKNQQINDQYLTDLSSAVVSRLNPQEQRYRWKVSRQSSGESNTRLTLNVTIKGFNNRTYVQGDFMVVKAQRQEVVLGSIFKSDDERGAGFLFDIEGHEYSFGGWKALFQLAASVTGDKYD